MSRKLTNKEFIDKAIAIHGDKYSYDECQYVNANSKVIIKCSIHGNFEQRSSSHIGNQKYGCPKCAEESRRLTLEYILEKANKTHGDKYDYSLVVENKPEGEKIQVICKKHGPFNVSIDEHINRGSGCPKCKSLNLDGFIEKANLVHKNKYDYSESVYVNNKAKIDIICPIHGKFNQRVSDHINGKNGCAACKESKGELKIREFLNTNNISFSNQKRFENCRSIYTLPFDFYLTDYNICIEFNGRQHYEPVSYFGGQKTLEETQKRDKIKMEYCQNNNIPLIIIKYGENIENILNSLFNNITVIF